MKFMNKNTTDYTLADALKAGTVMAVAIPTMVGLSVVTCVALEYVYEKVKTVGKRKKNFISEESKDYEDEEGS